MLSIALYSAVFREHRKNTQKNSLFSVEYYIKYFYLVSSQIACIKYFFLHFHRINTLNFLFPISLVEIQLKFITSSENF